jgi:hypothetical protein
VAEEETAALITLPTVTVRVALSPHNNIIVTVAVRTTNSSNFYVIKGNNSSNNNKDKDRLPTCFAPR